MHPLNNGSTNVCICVLQGRVGLLHCLLFVGFLRRTIRPEAEEQEMVHFQGGCDITKHGGDATFSLLAPVVTVRH